MLRTLLLLALCARAAAAAAGGSAQQCGTAWDVIRNDALFSTLASLAPAPPPRAAAAAGGSAFHEQLGVSEGQPYTFFAPTNAAFAQLSGNASEAAALRRDAAALGRLIRYHIVPGRTLLLAQLAGGELLATALPGAPPLVVERAAGGGAVRIRAQGGTATVSKADVVTCHGVLHGVDRVLLPQR